MNVSPEQHRKVLEMIQRTVSKIEQIYGFKFSVPITVKYDLNSSRVAGYAYSSTGLIRLNPMFMRNNEDFIDRTVPHEVVHIGVYQYYNIYLNNPSFRCGHGPEWKLMMQHIGKEPSRCHSYKKEEGFGRQQTKYQYVCAICNSILEIGAKVHRQIQQGQLRWHSRCGNRGVLIYKGIQPVLMAAETAQPVVPSTRPTPVPKKPNAPDPTSKLGRAYRLYKQYRSLSGMTRQRWISLFVSDADCTPAGASTYLSTCVKLFEQGV